MESGITTSGIAFLVELLVFISAIFYDRFSKKSINRAKRMTLFGIAASVAGLVTLKFPIEIIVDPTFTISRVSPLFVSVVVLAIAMPVFLFWRNRAAAQNSTSS